MARNSHFVTVGEVRAIAAQSGLSFAEFAVDQMASQMGAARCVKQRAELDRLYQASWRQFEDCCGHITPEMQAVLNGEG